MCSTAGSIRGSKFTEFIMSRSNPPSAFHRLARNRVALVSLAVLAFVVLIAVLGPFLLPARYHELTSNQFAPPSLTHPFGTDLNGRDVLCRVLEGARVSLAVGLSGALIAFFFGTGYGLV